jgi:HK97 family phage portal protein
MAIYDAFNKLIEFDNPDYKDIKKSFLTNRSGNYDEWSYIVHPASMGSLSYKLLRHIYQISSAVRPAVDSIAREISTLPWKVIHRDYQYHTPAETAKITDFLAHPNYDREGFSTVIHKYIVDMLVCGKGVIEKVRNPIGELKEIIARDSSLFAPKVNDYGFIINYIEYKRDTLTEIAKHRKENLIYKTFTPTSYSFGTCPIIETIINEVALLMLSVKAIAWAFTKDEIPPGVLHLGEIGEVALERAKASFEATKGILGQHSLRVVDNVDKVSWVPFTRPFREMQVAELMPMIERIVARNFGLSPVESSLTDVARGVAESSFASSQSKLTQPMMTTTAEMLNLEIVEELNDKAKFIYVRIPQESLDSRSKSYADLTDRGLITANEARLNLGFDPVKGGDLRTVRLGNEVAPFDEETGLPIYRKPEPVNAAPGQAGKESKPKPAGASAPKKKE